MFTIVFPVIELLFVGPKSFVQPSTQHFTVKGTIWLLLSFLFIIVTKLKVDVRYGSFCLK